jgi:hypothetical protein
MIASGVYIPGRGLTGLTESHDHYIANRSNQLLDIIENVPTVH